MVIFPTIEYFKSYENRITYLLDITFCTSFGLEQILKYSILLK